jgi:dTDP-4-amino-4,6-dideoxygalactose transaminase
LEIPFHKPYIDESDINSVVAAIKSGWLTMGPKTIEFENHFKQAVGSKHAVAVNSCTAAMHLALKAIGLQAGDEVIIPAMTFTATGEVVRYFDAVPVIVDVDKETHNILPAEIEKQLTKKTRAVIPVHFGGQPADMDNILMIAKKHKLKVIEDAAHCYPSYYRNKPVGTLGDITAFSFYATKTIACGDGGMATTENEQYAADMQMQRLHGISRDAWKRYSKEGSWYYEVIDAGYKYNMTDVQAALGLSQLNKAEKMWQLRAEIARRYSAAFSKNNYIQPPVIRPECQSSWHLYVIKLEIEKLRIGRNEFIEELYRRNIKTSVHFIPLYRHPYYQKNYPVDHRKMKNSEWLYERIISLPIYPGMSEAEIVYVIENILEIARRYAK